MTPQKKKNFNLKVGIGRISVGLLILVTIVLVNIPVILISIGPSHETNAVISGQNDYRSYKNILSPDNYYKPIYSFKNIEGKTYSYEDIYSRKNIENYDRSINQKIDIIYLVTDPKIMTSKENYTNLIITNALFFVLALSMIISGIRRLV